MSRVPKLRFSKFSGEWEEKSLNELGSVGRGKSKHRPRNDKVLFGGKYPFIQTGEVKSAGLYLKEYTQTYSEEGLKQSKLWEKDTLCITIAANIAETCLLGIEACFPDSIIGVNCFTDSSNPVFLKSYFDFLRKEFEKLAEGLAQDNLNLEKLLSMTFKVPSLPEQQEIASFLSSVDSKVEKLERKKELWEQYKKGMMQKIFSQELRFKDENGEDYPEWEEIKNLEIFELTRGNVLPMTEVLESKDDENIYPVFSSQTKNKGLSGFYKSFLFENSITWTTDGANAGDVNYRAGKFYCTNVCGVLINEKGYSNTCIAEMLNLVTHKYVSYVGNPKLMNNIMSNICIFFPSLLEQTHIANFLSSIDSKIEIVTKELTGMEEFKKGLLQQMFV